MGFKEGDIVVCKHPVIVRGIPFEPGVEFEVIGVGSEGSMRVGFRAKHPLIEFIDTIVDCSDFELATFSCDSGKETIMGKFSVGDIVTPKSHFQIDGTSFGPRMKLVVTKINSFSVEVTIVGANRVYQVDDSGIELVGVGQVDKGSTMDNLVRCRKLFMALTGEKCVFEMIEGDTFALSLKRRHTTVVAYYVADCLSDAEALSRLADILADKLREEKDKLQKRIDEMEELLK